MRKFFYKIHLWLSIPFGLIISIICFSGATLVFEEEITKALNPHLYNSAPNGRTEFLSTAELEQCISKQISSELTLVSLEIPKNGDDIATAQFKESGKKKLFINPYTGEINGWSVKYNFFSTMKKLHRWLIDVPPSKGEKTTGKVIVGISTIIMVFIIISGIIIWIPRTTYKALKKRLKVSTNKGWRRFMYDSHVAIGIYVSIFLLVMALTGLTWSFQWYREIAYSIVDSKSFFYSLHVGNWGGLFTKTIYFLSAMIGGTLPITGYYLWLKKRL